MERQRIVISETLENITGEYDTQRLQSDRVII